ncbi:hypothetical protein K1719_042489 [Acacia pycnantha]|nr:hypothetical protein K1719_042489 [Acacia pycnantha]
MADRDLERGGGTKNRADNNNSYPASSYAYDPETHWTSWLVPMFVVANVAVFIIVMYINNCPKHRENPLFGPSSNALTKMGALQLDKVVNHH